MRNIDDEPQNADWVKHTRNMTKRAKTPATENSDAPEISKDAVEVIEPVASSDMALDKPVDDTVAPAQTRHVHDAQMEAEMADRFADAILRGIENSRPKPQQNPKE